MRYAINPDDLFESRIEATPKARGLCIGCKAEMIARCGSQRIHHWENKPYQVTSFIACTAASRKYSVANVQEGAINSGYLDW